MEESRQWLQDYAENGSENAFERLVTRHAGLVYAMALRRLNGDHDLARDVAQTVFADLARKAARLPESMIISAWLYRHTTFVSSHFARAHRRRLLREQEAMRMSGEPDQPRDPWTEIEPHVDGALNSLPAHDRNAILLRYFESRDLRSVGLALGISEDAAQKRISRAIERLRALLKRRGVAVTAAALAGALSVNATATVPAALTATLSQAALAGAAVPVFSTVLGNLIIMSKAKVVLGIVLVSALATPLIVQQQTIQRLRAENERLQIARTPEPPPAATPAPAPPDTSVLELARLRAEVTQLRQATQALARAKLVLARTNQVTQAAPPPARPRDYIASDTWRDAGLSSPEAAMQTFGWAIRNGDTLKFRDSVFVTDAARKFLSDMLTNFPPEALAQVQQKGWGVEEGLFFPAVAQDRKETYKGFRIVSEDARAADEVVFHTEIETEAGKTHARPFRFKKVGDDWKQYYDVADLQELDSRGKK